MPRTDSQPCALVIDYDETVVDQITQVMHKMGCAVQNFIDGLDGLGRCQSSRFDVIVCDVRMPRLSGLSFLSNLANTPNAATKVIMISTLDDNAIRNLVLASGASAYLVKQIATQSLRDSIGGVSGKH